MFEAIKQLKHTYGLSVAKKHKTTNNKITQQHIASRSATHPLPVARRRRPPSGRCRSRRRAGLSMRARMWKRHIFWLTPTAKRPSLSLSLYCPPYPLTSSPAHPLASPRYPRHGTWQAGCWQANWSEARRVGGEGSGIIIIIISSSSSSSSSSQRGGLGSGRGGSMLRGRCHGLQHGYIAEWLERLAADQRVPGSNPNVPIRLLPVACPHDVTSLPPEGIDGRAGGETDGQAAWGERGIL